MFRSDTILVLARWILIAGSISLVAGGIRLFLRAADLGMSAWHLAYILPIAVVVGGVKARFVMRRRMRRNIARLRAHTGPLWPWQIYPPPLFIFIITMMILMNVLKRVLAGNALGLGSLGGVDIGIAVALVVASFEYGDRGGIQSR